MKIKVRAWNDLGDGQGEMITEESHGLTSAQIMERYSDCMLYSGVKEQEGGDKQYCEGDIVECMYYRANKRWWRTASEIPTIEKEVQEQRERAYKKRFVIEFRNGCFCLGGTYLPLHRINCDGEIFDQGRGYTSDYEEKYFDFKIIGNTRENPGLVYFEEE